MKNALIGQQTIPNRAFEVLVAYLTLIIPTLGFVVAIIVLPKPTLFDFLLFITFYFFSLLGITLGYHRLFTHRSYTAPLWFEYFIGICAAMAAQGSLFFWVAVHRHHHTTSDTDSDIHSPMKSTVFKNKWTAFFHSHMFWMTEPIDLNCMKFIKDLLQRKDLYYLNQYYLIWVMGGILLPALIAACYYHSWQGFFLGLFWGGLVRIFIGHHVTWSINSICHIWGKQDYSTKDNSRNNAIFGILALGEGWHNNHHAFPYSARHGLQWWQLDITYIMIRLLAALGIVSQIKLPTKGNIEQRSNSS